MSNLGAKGFNPKKGSMPVLNYMPPAMLTVDAAYQRSIANSASQKLIIHIAKNWNWDLCQPLVVNRREDGTLAVADGQHRLTAAIMRGDIDVLPCVVCNLPDLASEADLFVQFNRSRKALKPLDLWKAAVASGEEAALQVVAALDAAGLKVHNTTSNRDMPPGAIQNVNALRRCLQANGIDRLQATLEIMAGAYPDETLSYCGTLFTGILSIVTLETHEGDPAAWRTGYRAGLVTDCIGSRKQAHWFRQVQLGIADGNTRVEATERVFRHAWKIWQGGIDRQPGEAAVTTTALPPPPKATELAPAVTAQLKPEAAKPPKPTAKPATPPPSFEEQLRRVEAGEVGICDKIEMKRNIDETRTFGGVVGEINL